MLQLSVRSLLDRPSNGLLAMLSGYPFCVSLYPLATSSLGSDIATFDLPVLLLDQTTLHPPEHILSLPGLSCCSNSISLTLLGLHSSSIVLRSEQSQRRIHKACNFRPSRSARGSEDKYPFWTHPQLACTSPPSKRPSFRPF